MTEERKIMEIKTIEKLTYFEARKKYRAQVAPTFSKSYAQVVHAPKSMATISTQTESVKTPQKTCEEKSAEPAKANNPAQKNVINLGSSGKNPKKTTTGTTQTKRGKSQSPGPSGSAPNSEPESMEEDEYLSESEILRAKAKGRRNRTKR
jgi:hypothetical protein